MDSKKQGFRHIKDPCALKQMLETRFIDRLAHYAGSAYAGAAKTCLNISGWIECEESEFQEAIRRKVLSPLQASV